MNCLRIGRLPKRLSLQFHQKLLTKLGLSSYAESVLPLLFRKNLKPFIHPSKKRIFWDNLRTSGLYMNLKVSLSQTTCFYIYDLMDTTLAAYQMTERFDHSLVIGFCCCYVIENGYYYFKL